MKNHAKFVHLAAPYCQQAPHASLFSCLSLSLLTPIQDLHNLDLRGLRLQERNTTSDLDEVSLD